MFALLSVGACDDGFEDLNVNPTKPTQVKKRLARQRGLFFTLQHCNASLLIAQQTE